MRERRQVVDIPPVKVRVVEHRVETKQCPTCGVETGGEFPEGVEAPAQYGPGVATVAVYLNQEQLLPEERKVLDWAKKHTTSSTHSLLLDNR